MKLTRWLTGCSLALLIVGASFSEQSSKTRIERLDPALDSLIAKDASLQKLADGFKWTEGPVWIPAGYLLFAEIPSNSIRKWSPGDTTASIFMQPSGYTGSKVYGGPEPGSNGMTLDAHNRLTVAGHAKRSVWRLETMDPHGKRTTLADNYEGKRLNSPNDLVYKSDGALYFTDPPYGLRSQHSDDPEKELNFSGVYRLPSGGGKLRLLIRDLPRPNGIAFSPDEKTLYVNNSEPQKIWMQYHVEADGSVSQGKLFFDASSDKRDGSPDGMKVDHNGNIYGTGPGGIWIFSPAGKHLGTIDLPEKAGNLAWGEADGKTLYITASSGLYRIRMKATGVKPGKQ